MEALKAEQLTGSKWRVLAIPFGGPFKGKDFDGEYFDRDTDIKRAWFPAHPVVFHHGADEAAKDELYGEEELDAEPDSEGWWGTVWLNRSARYWAEVDSMLRSGKMFGSSGSIGHLVRKDHKTGHIEVWPHIEQTLTPTPANPYSRITAAKAIDVLTTAGIAVPDDLHSDLSEPAAAATDGEDAAMKARVLILAERTAARGRLLTI